MHYPALSVLLQWTGASYMCCPASSVLSGSCPRSSKCLLPWRPQRTWETNNNQQMVCGHSRRLLIGGTPLIDEAHQSKPFCSLHTHDGHLGSAVYKRLDRYPVHLAVDVEHHNARERLWGQASSVRKLGTDNLVLHRPDIRVSLPGLYSMACSMLALMFSIAIAFSISRCASTSMGSAFKRMIAACFRASFSLLRVEGFRVWGFKI